MAEERVQRRLAAILAADVVGYSRLMGSDEAGTLGRLKALRREVFAPTITEFGGRIFKLTGDGAFAEFASATDAVNSAVAVQCALTERNAGSSDDWRIELRIGISLGDVIVEGSDLYGNGVNVAARMEGLAEPGGICISGNVYEHVGQSPRLAFEDLGDQTVKNIERPVRCYRVQMERSEASEVGAQLPGVAPKFSDKPSIAVLPFYNLSGDPGQEYFSDGMTEDLITDLSKVPELFVIARHSSFAYKQSTRDIKEIGRALGVGHILEGSVRKMGQRIRINAQLIDAASGGHLWAERYDVELEEIFSLQDEIAAQIVAALELSLTSQRSPNRSTTSLEAYELSLKGRAKFFMFTPETNRECIRLFEEAVGIDPNFSDAWAGQVLPFQTGWYFVWPGYDDGMDIARTKADRAVELAPNSSFALSRLGWAQTFLFEPQESVASFERSLKLDPNNPDTLSFFAEALNYAGHPKRAVEIGQASLHFDPVAPPTCTFHIGHAYFLLGELEKANERIGQAIDRAPAFLVARLIMAATLVELGKCDEAEKQISVLREIHPQYNVSTFNERCPYNNDEHRARVLAGLRAAGLPEK